MTTGTARARRATSDRAGQQRATPATRTPPGRSTVPGLRVEKRLLRSGHTLLGACDEVGRGALGGPVTVGIVLVDASVQRPLAGVRDSKLLTPAARVALVPRIRRWVVGHAVGHATAEEIDEHGIIAGLRMAGHRALAALPARPDVVLLDGNHDWLSSPRRPTLFDGTPLAEPAPPRVATMIKADLQCASVAAASVLAKTERDALMVRLAGQHPGYGWEENKGYSTAGHVEALRRLGPCVHHRQSWRLPELATPDCDGLWDDGTRPVVPDLAGGAVAKVGPTDPTADPVADADLDAEPVAEPGVGRGMGLDVARGAGGGRDAADGR
ncbi:ribonuclease HII [uncultured Cellulomonas sp.]|uniref:ribonuclease HII n=1 Tax=uncultured Cellulomonas sp. TaxID=189682 RepID=UPI00345B8736